jgi:hypothetical protein
MTNVKTMLASCLLLLGLVVLGGHSEEPKKDPAKDKGSPKVSELMQRKLKHAQRVLEGVVTNDSDKIAENAEELMAISKEAEWKVLKTPSYELFSNEFRRTADTLVKNAKEKNLDAAALNYVELTLNCVKCHKYVRESPRVRLDP